MSEPDDVALPRAEALRGPGSMRDGVRTSLHELLEAASLPSWRKFWTWKGRLWTGIAAGVQILAEKP